MSRKVIKIDQRGAVMCKYPSIDSAARENGVNIRRITARCKRQMRQFEWIYDPVCRKMYTFRYESDPAVGLSVVQVNESRPVCMIDKMGNVLAEYRSAKAAADQTGWSHSKVWRHCSGVYSNEWENGASFSFRWKGDKGL